MFGLQVARATTTAAVLVATFACGSSSASAPSTPAASPGATWQVLVSGSGIVSGLALDGLGDLYAVEYDKNRIIEYTVQGAVVRQWGSAGSGPGQWNTPIRVAIDAKGDVYITDTGNNRIQKFSATGQPLAQWGKLGDGPGQFDFPEGVTVDAQGNIYVADTRNARIQKLSPTGTPVLQWGRSGDQPGQFNRMPVDLALDRHGDIFVTEANGLNRIHEFSVTGAFLGRWGGSGDSPGQFNEPRGLAFDKNGDVYVADTGNNRIQKLTSSGKFISLWAGPSAHPFPEPTALALDGSGYLYVSDLNLILRTCVLPSGCS